MPEPLRLVVTADASSLQSELGGKATQSVQNFAARTEASMGQASVATQRYGNLTRDQFRQAQESFMIFDRTLHLGLTRERRAILTAYPEIAQVFAKMGGADRKSTRLNSSHLGISYA